MMFAVVLTACLHAAPGTELPASSEQRPADTQDVGVVINEDVDPTVFPDPSKFARGFFVEGATGASVPLGTLGRVLSPGFGLTARLGYEFRRWAAVQAHAHGSISRYDDDVITGEIFQQYAYTGELRFGIPIRRFLIAAQGGAGVYQLGSNLLQVAGLSPDNRLWGFAYDASLAVDFHSLSRHFSGGLLATYIGMPRLDQGSTLTIQLYLRYTL